ncbi:MAG: hypothetical protein U1D65_19935 [Pseudomonas sp.]|nr:hypothetical protein [Pseudomonas sp.]MDZ4194262.1 hypothetical protein [Pseudomonas sp.]
MQEPRETNSSTLDDQDVPSLNPAIIGWAIAAIVLSILAVTFNNSAMVLGAGFIMKFLAVVVGSVLGLIGALLGDAIRKFAHPDAVFTNGGLFQLVWIKVFWLLGPQLIGLVLGAFLGISLVLR